MSVIAVLYNVWLYQILYFADQEEARISEGFSEEENLDLTDSQ